MISSKNTSPMLVFRRSAGIRTLCVNVPLYSQKIHRTLTISFSDLRKTAPWTYVFLHSRKFSACTPSARLLTSTSGLQDQPTVGGDTLFVSQVEAYNRLSDEFKKRLEGLWAVHSAVEQAENSAKRGGPVRREPVETEVSVATSNCVLIWYLVLIGLPSTHSCGRYA